MPEFRFRRKKQQSHRHTLHDAEETSQQIKAAKEQVDLENQADLEVQRGEEETEKHEREKFFELLKSKYPEQTNGIEIDQLANGGPPSLANGHLPTQGEDESNEPINFQNDDDVIKTSSTSQLPSIKPTLVRRISSRFSECIFLRHGSDLRRCPMPSPITISTIKNLFVNMFDLSPSLLDDPKSTVFIKDKETQRWRLLENTSAIYDRCMLLMVDPSDDHTPNNHAPSQEDLEVSTPLDLGSDGSREEEEKSDGKRNNGLWRSDMGGQFEDLSVLPDNLPIHPPPHNPTTLTLTQSPFTLTSSSSGASGTSTREPLIPATIVTTARFLQRDIHSLREEVYAMRQDHMGKMADFTQEMQTAIHRVTAAISAHRKTGGISFVGTDMFRRERLELYPEEESYIKRSKHTLHDISVLQLAVEEVQVDVVQRRCKVVEGEVESLTVALNTAIKTLQELRESYAPLESRLKKVMEQELRVIVSEERFVQEEGLKLVEASDRCRKLTETLETLGKFASVQSHRTPRIPYFAPVQNPDRQALMGNIEAITPNHLHRVEAIELSETVHKMKKEMSSPKSSIRKFENQLRIRKDHLRSTRNTEELENRREMKLKASFLSEKFEREKSLAREVELQKKLAAKKREEEKREVEERWVSQQRQRLDERRSRQRLSQENVVQNVLSENRIRNSLIMSGYPPPPPPFPSRTRSDSMTNPPPPPFQTRTSSDNVISPPNHTQRRRSGDNIAPVHGRTHSDDVTAHGGVTSTNAFTNNIPRTGRGSLAPYHYRKGISNLPPRERKSIGYVGEFDSFDPYTDPEPVVSRNPPTSGNGGRKQAFTEQNRNPKPRKIAEPPPVQRRGSDDNHPLRHGQVATMKFDTHESRVQEVRRIEGVHIPISLSQPETEERQYYDCLAPPTKNAPKKLHRSASDESLYSNRDNVNAAAHPLHVAYPMSNEMPRKSYAEPRQVVIPQPYPSHDPSKGGEPPTQPRKPTLYHSYTQFNPHPRPQQAKTHVQVRGQEQSSRSRRRENRPTVSANRFSLSDNHSAAANRPPDRLMHAPNPPLHVPNPPLHWTHLPQHRHSEQDPEPPLTSYPRHTVNAPPPRPRGSRHSSRITQYPSTTNYPVRNHIGSLV